MDQAVDPGLWIGYAAACLLLFVKFATAPELLFTITGVNLKVLYVIAPLAYIAIPFSPGFQLALRHKAIIFFLGFYLWMVLATPLSSWPGDSATRAKDFLIHILPLALVVSGLFTGWKHLRTAFGIMALSAVAILAITRIFPEHLGDRFGLASSGLIGNPNDLAAHLLWLIPFLGFVVLDPMRNWFWKLASVAGIAYGMYVILATGSRGALVAIAACSLFAIWKAKPTLKLGFIVATVIAVLLIPPLLPNDVRVRLGSLLGETHVEGEASKDAREYAFWKSVEFTLTHPMFGVGPGQFPNFEGRISRTEGLRGAWRDTHCIWTQISSECGIPALLLFLGSLGYVFFRVNLHYEAAKKAGQMDIAAACLCFMIGFIGYYAAVTFISQAYYFHSSAIIGLGVAIDNVVVRRNSA